MQIFDLENMVSREIVPGYSVRLVHSENVTIAYWDVEAGSVLPKHAHHHEQVSQVTEGEFELTVEGRTLHLKPGKVVVIPSNAEHTGKAITKCKITDTFYPVREDYQ